MALLLSGVVRYEEPSRDGPRAGSSTLSSVFFSGTLKLTLHPENTANDLIIKYITKQPACSAHESYN